jgi:hypothetical protein
VKRTVAFIVPMVLAAGLATPRVAAAQEKPALVPIKIDLVVSRNAGAKKISSLPYSLWVTANDVRERTSLRMGVQVPVASTRIAQKDDPPPPAYTYRDVGTNIDCSATTIPDGRFNVRIVLNDSAVQFDGKETVGTRSVPGLPSFRNFSASFTLLLRDGQTAMYTSATDPVSGETLKVDVTLSVLK